MFTIKKVTRLRVRIYKSTIKSIFIVIPFGLRETRKQIIFWNLFYFINVKYHQWCHLKRYKSHLITIKKVTRLRVRISKSRIKLIFMVFPSGLRQTHLIWKLFYFNIVHCHQWCHLNMYS